MKTKPQYKAVLTLRAEGVKSESETLYSDRPINLKELKDKIIKKLENEN